MTRPALWLPPPRLKNPDQTSLGKYSGRIHLNNILMKFPGIPRITRDPVLKRLRWLMVFVILVDTANTLLGQPASYAENPATAAEFNEFMRVFVRLGPLPFLASSGLYIAGCFVCVSTLPRKLAYATLFALILGHYFGASTWLTYHWEFGMQAAVIYAIVIAVGLVLCGISPPIPAALETKESADS